MLRSLTIIVLLCALLVPALAQKKPRRPARVSPPAEKAEKTNLQKLDQEATDARDNLLVATENYQASLEKLQAFYKAERERAAELVEKRRRLFDLGVLARRELVESEDALREAEEKIAEVSRQIGEAEQLMAEVIVAEEEAKKAIEARRRISRPLRSGLVMVRYSGLSNWSLGEAAKVEAFYQERFGRPLPVSAWGQTATHTHLGFDHRNAFDVALHPDSAEGRALMEYLRGQGVPFIAFRAAVSGSATGVHIHIGSPSRRLASPH